MTVEERKKQYAQLCGEGKINALFMQPWWLDATGTWDVSLAFRNQQLIGAMPFGLRRRLGIKLISMPLMTHHLQIWMDKPPDISAHKWLTREKQIIWSLIENLPAYGFFSMVFTQESFDNWLPFYWKSFRQEMRYTFIITNNHLTDPDQQINRNLKRNIREASQAMYIDRDIEPQRFYKECFKTYSRQNMKMPYTLDTFLRLDKAITANKAGIKLGAFSTEKKLLAVSYLLFDQHTAYYFLAGDDIEGRSSGASIFLCREAIQIAFEDKKVKTFDFCGSMLEPITEIRRQFGAQSSPLLKIFKAQHRWLDIIYQLTH